MGTSYLHSYHFFGGEKLTADDPSNIQIAASRLLECTNSSIQSPKCQRQVCRCSVRRIAHAIADPSSSTAIISVYDKTGLLDLAKGLIKNNVRLLASGGTARMIRESGFSVE